MHEPTEVPYIFSKDECIPWPCHRISLDQLYVVTFQNVDLLKFHWHSVTAIRKIAIQIFVHLCFKLLQIPHTLFKILRPFGTESKVRRWSPFAVYKHTWKLTFSFLVAFLPFLDTGVSVVSKIGKGATRQKTLSSVFTFMTLKLLRRVDNWGERWNGRNKWQQPCWLRRHVFREFFSRQVMRFL